MFRYFFTHKLILKTLVTMYFICVENTRTSKLYFDVSTIYLESYKPGLPINSLVTPSDKDFCKVERGGVRCGINVGVFLRKF